MGLNPDELTNIAEFAEANAMADLHLAAPPDFAARWGMRVERFGPAIGIIMAGAGIPLFNRVVGLGVVEPATEETVERIATLYGEAGVRPMVQLVPSARPAVLPVWLEARGIRPADNWVKVIRGPEPPPPVPTDLRVELIGPEGAPDHARIASEVFGVPLEFEPWLVAGVGRPGWTHYLAYDGDLPAATAALFVKDEVAWLGIGATLPPHRRRGGQGALLARRIQDAAAAGCKWLVTETWQEHPPQHPNPSYHNMLRMGFELAYVRGNYLG
jgi:GNAT superfamily N-acetyltransferase